MVTALRDIDIALLRSFIAVAETGRMTRAARVINRSQGAVSQQVQRLERLFEAKLFDRRADAIRLTPEGERLLPKAHRLVSLNNAILAEMRQTDFTGEVRLGVPPDIVAIMLPPILRAFTEAHPNVLVTLVSATTDLLIQQLESGAVDVALLTEPTLGRHGELLLTDQLVWVGARDGDAHRRRPLSVALGPEHGVFRTAAVHALTSTRIDWRAICQIGSLEPVFATLEADMAVGVFLSHTVPDWLAIVPKGELPPLPPFHINLRLRSAEADLVSLELASHIREGLLRRYG